MSFRVSSNLNHSGIVCIIKRVFLLLFPSTLPLYPQGGISLALLQKPNHATHPPVSQVSVEPAHASAFLFYTSILEQNDSSLLVFA